MKPEVGKTPGRDAQTAQADKALGRLSRALKTLSAINRALLREVDEQSLLREICRVVVEEAGYRMAWVSHADSTKKKTVRPIAHFGFEEGFLAAKRTWAEGDERSRGPNATAIRTGKPSIVNDVHADPSYSFWREEALRRGYGSVIGLPICVEGEAFGALSIYASERDAFDEQEVDLLAQTAEDVGYGIAALRTRAKRAHGEKEILRLHRALRTLTEINRAQSRAADEESLLADACRVAVEVCGYRMAWAGYAMQDEQKSIRIMAHAGFEEGFLESAHLSWADTERQGASGTAIRTGKPCVIRNLLTDPKVALWREEAMKRGYASAIALPLYVSGEVLGNFTICAAEPDAFGEEESKLLCETADDLAYGIESLRTRLKAKHAEETIKRMAYYDALTALPNRVRLLGLLEEAIAAAKSQKRPLALLLIGVGRFGEINETLGYREADKLVQQIALRLQEAVGDRERVARMGEDEFAVFVPRCDSENATRFASKLLLALYEPVELSGLMLDPRASIGIALFPGHGTDPNALIRRGTVALHQATRSGSGYAVYAGGLDKDSTRRLGLMGDLRRGIENNELLLYCQPKVDIPLGRVCGAEALVRWRHPEQGMINPAEFIKLAETTGLITPLTFWMLDAAVSQIYSWREDGLETPLAVNLSARDLHDPKLLDRIKGCFATWGAQSDWIQFELTESALMEDPAGSLATLGRLKELGVELFIDDFGTGYSSLSYLQKLPVDAIKVDQSFVADMIENNDSAVIVRSTIELAHSLDLKVVAEGVENQETWDRLAAMGCDVAQGYAVSKPMPVDEFKHWEESSPWTVKSASKTS